MSIHPLRYSVRQGESFEGYVRFWVWDCQERKDASGMKLSRQAAQRDADMKNGELLRLAHESKVKKSA